MAKIGVIGLGNFGITLAHHLALNGHEVVGWTVESEVAQSVNATRRHPRFMPEVSIHAGVTATTSKQDLKSASSFVLVLPSQVLAQVVPEMDFMQDCLVVSAVKGLVGDAAETPLQYLRQRWGNRARVVALSGPTFATEVIKQKPCGIVAASHSEGVAREAMALFSSPTMRVYISTDPLGVEMGGILKNVIAIAVGISDGLNFGDSARAGLITRGLAEMTRLAEAMGANVRTLAGLSGLGDLAMTATCDTSRNRTVGLRLGRGEKLETIIATLGSVAEGVRTTPIVLDLAKRYQVEMPISAAVALVIKGEIGPLDMAKMLLSRPIKREF